MEKVIHLLESFKTIFYFNFLGHVCDVLCVSASTLITRKDPS
jgi:hypothetical protein